MTVEFAIRAREDFRTILSHLETVSPDAAAHLVDRLEQRCATLSQHPQRGRIVRTIRDRELRRLIASPYLILYVVTARGARIVRIVHALRDLDTLLKDEPLSSEDIE